MKKLSFSHSAVSENIWPGTYQFSKPGEAYFITLSTDAGGRETAEITHEALFEHWGSLKQWLAEKRDDLPFVRRLEEAARHWENQERPDGLLWRTPDLDSLKYDDRGNMTELPCTKNAQRLYWRNRSPFYPISCCLNLLIWFCVSRGIQFQSVF